MFFPSYPVKVLATDGSDELAQKVCLELRSRLPQQTQPEFGLILSQTRLTWFPNGNPEAQIENVRGRFVVIIHTQVPPASNHTIELFATLDAVVEAEPADVLVVFPYMPYSRSDRKNQPRISVMSNRFAKIISESFGIERVLLMDPHDTHIKHYFTKKSANEITAVHLLLDYVRRQVFTSHPPSNCVVVFADGGSADRFEPVPHWLDLPAVYIDKVRLEPHPQIKGIVGNVAGKHCILIDDETLTGGTSVMDATALLELGKAASVSVALIHPILEDGSEQGADVIRRLEQSPIEEIIVTNSVPVERKLALFGAQKFTVLSVAPLLAEAISHIVQNESLTELHDPKNVVLYNNPLS